MRTSRFGILTLLAASLAATAVRGQSTPFANVAALQTSHDRALIRDLTAYIEGHPKAEDLDQAYMALFNKAIEHDWFSDHEEIANRYLKAYPDGPMLSLARIVATMARAQGGRYDEALDRFRELMRGLGKTEQEEFAVNFADTLANSASAAGEYRVAREVYSILLERYGESPTLRQKVKDELNRIDRIGKPAPAFSVQDVAGKPLRLDGFKGKYVLVDFWATWCAPCIAELPRVQAAYERFHPEGFEVIGVSLDETKAALTDFVATRNIPWRQVHNASSGGDLVEAFGVNTIPATFLIDPRGMIVRMELRGSSLEQTLGKLIKLPAAAAAGSDLPLR